MDQQLAIVVSSCDAYADAWDPFFILLRRYWPDCPYKIYLLSESSTYPDARVISLTVNDSSWATRLKRSLREIPEPYVLYLQEDYFLKRPVDTARIRELFGILSTEHIGSLRIYPDPAPQLPFKGYPDVGEVRRGTPYRLSLQATIWDKEILQSLLREDDNPWNTEHEGSKRSDKLPEPFLSVTRNSPWSRTVSPVFEYVCTGISKRLWTWDAVHLFRREGIKADLTRRSIETYATYVRRRLRQLPYLKKPLGFIYRVEYKISTLLH